jgi:hypothetical protein
MWGDLAESGRIGRRRGPAARGERVRVERVGGVDGEDPGACVLNPSKRRKPAGCGKVQVLLKTHCDLANSDVARMARRLLKKAVQQGRSR